MYGHYQEAIYREPTNWKASGPGKKIVTIIVDSGLKYLNGDLYKF